MQQHKKNLWIVRDPSGNRWGPIEGAAAARKWATEKWPGTPEHDDDAPQDGPTWEIESLFEP